MSPEFQTVISHSGLGVRGWASWELTQGHVGVLLRLAGLPSQSLKDQLCTWPQSCCTQQAPLLQHNHGMNHLHETTSCARQDTENTTTSTQSQIPNCDHSLGQTINNCSHAAEELSFKQDGAIFPKLLGASPSEPRT